MRDIQREFRKTTYAALAVGILVGMAGGLSIGLSQGPTLPPVAPVPTVTVPPVNMGESPIGAFSILLPDCESDRDNMFPCVTFDESEWRIVFALGDGYDYQVTRECRDRTGGPVMPCVVRHTDKEQFTLYANHLDIS